MLGEYVAPEYAVDWVDDKAFPVQRRWGDWRLLLQIPQEAVKQGDVAGVKGLLAVGAGDLSADAVTEIDWNTALYVANTLQFLPGFAWLAAGQHWMGGSHRMMPDVPDSAVTEGDKPVESAATLDPEWQVVAEMADERLHPVMARWAAAGVLVPKEPGGCPAQRVGRWRKRSVFGL
jgi:hypothetical protein